VYSNVLKLVLLDILLLLLRASSST
jgi:hypothetical protein